MDWLGLLNTPTAALVAGCVAFIVILMLATKKPRRIVSYDELSRNETWKGVGKVKVWRADDGTIVWWRKTKEKR